MLREDVNDIVAQWKALCDSLAAENRTLRAELGKKPIVAWPVPPIEYSPYNPWPGQYTYSPSVATRADAEGLLTASTHNTETE